MYLRKISPRTTCLYSAASMLLRRASAACQSFASNPRFALAHALAPRPLCTRSSDYLRRKSRLAEVALVQRTAGPQMPTREFDLNIERVLENWTVAHAIRELIANALDEAALTGTVEPEIAKDTGGRWHIRDFGRG